MCVSCLCVITLRKSKIFDVNWLSLLFSGLIIKVKSWSFVHSVFGCWGFLFLNAIRASESWKKKKVYSSWENYVGLKHSVLVKLLKVDRDVGFEPRRSRGQVELLFGRQTCSLTVGPQAPREIIKTLIWRVWFLNEISILEIMGAWN